MKLTIKGRKENLAPSTVGVVASATALTPAGGSGGSSGGGGGGSSGSSSSNAPGDVDGGVPIEIR